MCHGRSGGVVFRINGTEYTDASGKKISEIVDDFSYDTEYALQLTVTDKAGNSVVKEATFVVDKPIDNPLPKELYKPVQA